MKIKNATAMKNYKTENQHLKRIEKNAIALVQALENQPENQKLLGFIRGTLKANLMELNILRKAGLA